MRWQQCESTVLRHVRWRALPLPCKLVAILDCLLLLPLLLLPLLLLQSLLLLLLLLLVVVLLLLLLLLLLNVLLPLLLQDLLLLLLLPPHLSLLMRLHLLLPLLVLKLALLSELLLVVHCGWGQIRRRGAECRMVELCHPEGPSEYDLEIDVPLEQDVFSRPYVELEVRMILEELRARRLDHGTQVLAARLERLFAQGLELAVLIDGNFDTVHFQLTRKLSVCGCGLVRTKAPLFKVLDCVAYNVILHAHIRLTAKQVAEVVAALLRVFRE